MSKVDIAVFQGMLIAFAAIGAVLFGIFIMHLALERACKRDERERERKASAQSTTGAR